MLKLPFLSIHFSKSKVKDDLSPCFKGNAQAQFSKQRLTQADATPWHEILTLSSNENTNPFSKQTKALSWRWKKRELCCFCVLNAVEKQGQYVSDQWDVPTPSPPLEGASHRSYYSLTYSGWGDERGDLWPTSPPQPWTPPWRRKGPTTEQQRPCSISINSH